MAVAYVAPEDGAEGISLGTVGTRQGDIDQRSRPRQSTSQPLVLVYEAGPGGSWLSRELTPTGHGCGVVAPALLPPKTGDRVNTDRRDASPWARLLRAGALTPV